jgi:hypothetical protein
MLSEKHIIQFRELYKKHFGEEITEEEAREQGIKLIGLVKNVYRPMTFSEFEKVQKYRHDLDKQS